MPNVKFKQNVYILDRFNRCLIDCPHCHVFQYDRAYTEKSRETSEIFQSYMNLRTKVYKVRCPSCNREFEMRINKKEFEGMWETVYITVPIKKNSDVPLLKP